MKLEQYRGQIQILIKSIMLLSPVALILVFGNHMYRYEEITSKKLLGKRKRSGQLEERDDMLPAGEATASKPPEKKRHKELQKRLDKMDKRGFLKPS